MQFLVNNAIIKKSQFDYASNCAFKFKKERSIKRRLMKKENSSTLLSNTEGYMSISLWDQDDDESTYYDRRLDLQGEVPGCSLKEAKKAFEEKYGIKL